MLGEGLCSLGLSAAMFCTSCFSLVDNKRQAVYDKVGLGGM